MPAPLFDITRLQHAIESGSLIITANNRLANHICQTWGQKQRESGRSCWQLPAVFALESWITQQWQELCDRETADTRALVLNSQQEQLIWQAAIHEDEQNPAGLPVAATARQCATAYQLVQQWLIPESQLQSDSAHLSRWVCSFRKKLAQLQAITPSDRIFRLENAMQLGGLSHNHEIVLVGFQTVPPLQLRLLQGSCDRLTEQAAEKISSPGVKVSLHDEMQEIQAAAIWAKERLTESPEQRIGIVIPSLTRLRPQIERLFHEQLSADWPDINKGDEPAPFNISAATLLAQTPLVDSALLLLSLNRQKLPLADCCRLLNSPFWGNAELSLRAETEFRLRQLASAEIPAATLRFQASKIEQERFPGEADSLSRRLETFETLRRAAPAQQRCSDWFALFSRQLAALNWPGERGLNSVEYQQHKQWEVLLEEAAKINQVKISLSSEEALNLLRTMAEKMPFQAETPDRPVQILGALEAIGLRFDHLWLTGMTDQVWPQPCHFNPLLPVYLQRQYQTPLSSPERELAIAREVIHQFQCNASNLIFSHSQYEGDSELRCSPLIDPIPEVSIDELINPAALNSSRYTDHPTVTLERVDCSEGPPLTTEDSVIKGGSGIFDAQAGCPFNAFARYRLGAEAPPEPALGLSPAERGSLLHQVMETIWRALGSREGLLSLDDEALDSLLEKSIESALFPLQQKRRDLMSPVFIALEKGRLQALIQHWVAVEKERPDFHIHQLEQNLEINFAGLALKLKIDRIDEITGGEKVIIDYKTGKTAIKSWFGERPTQPQLPLYSLSSGAQVSAICFASINVEQQAFSGVGRDTTLLPGLIAADSYEGIENWQQLQQHWSEKLTALAEEFRAGCADVTVYNPRVLDWEAELLPLNRWYGYHEETES